jgi:hypothetical protein
MKCGYYCVFLTPRKVAELSVTRRIELTRETVQCWLVTFGPDTGPHIGPVALALGGECHLD